MLDLGKTQTTLTLLLLAAVSSPYYVSESQDFWSNDL